MRSFKNGIAISHISVVNHLKDRKYAHWNTNVIKGDYSTKRPNKLDNVYNSSFRKIDIVIYPQIVAEFGNFNDPIETQINIIPSIETTLWKGMNLTAQVIFSLQNDFKEYENSIRPGIISLEQSLKIGRTFFINIGVGQFTNNRYGIDISVFKPIIQGKIYFLFRNGITGYSTITDNRWKYTRADNYTFLLSAGWFMKKYCLQTQITYGKYIHSDYGWRADISRQFKEVNIGFFYMETNNVANGGFYFSVPIPPRKYKNNKSVRIIPAQNFSWQYTGKKIPNEGQYYNTGTKWNEIIIEYNPQYLRKEVADELN